MRILLTTRGSAGHLLPLAPFVHAALGAGHDVLVAAQRQYAGNVERAGLPSAPFDEPPPEQWMPMLADFGQQDLDTSNAVMIGEYFGRLDTAAALPGLGAIVENSRPDVIVRDCWEYASTLVAEQRGIPVARAALGLGAVCRSSCCRCSASTSGRTPPPWSAPGRASPSTRIAPRGASSPRQPPASSPGSGPRSSAC
jgi:UDP:flavonoid glycosyltransferase YjiC (YdhE family)